MSFQKISKTSTSMSNSLRFSRKLLSTHYARYLFVGGAAFIADYLTFILFGNFLSIFFANAIALSVGFVISFYGNKYLVFSAKDDKKQRYSTKVQMLIYIVLLGVNTLLTFGIISLLISFGADVLIAKVISMFFIVVWNFIIYRYIIFK